MVLEFNTLAFLVEGVSSKIHLPHETSKMRMLEEQLIFLDMMHVEPQSMNT